MTQIAPTADKAASRSPQGAALLTPGMREGTPPVIIIGAGPVGLFAAMQVGMRGMRPVILDTMAQAGGQCAAIYPEREISDVPGFPAMGAAALVDALKARTAPFDPLYLFGRRAMSVWGSSESGFNVETDTGETITGAGVIFAGGAGALCPRRIAATGIDELTAASLGFCAETAPAKSAIAIVGAGPAAVDAALSLAERPSSQSAGDKGGVTLIHDAAISAAPDRLDAIHDAVRVGRIQLVQGDVIGVDSRDGRLTAIDVDTGAGLERLAADYLLVQAGLHLAPAAVTGLAPVADAATGETETPGVFIAGDAVSDGDGEPLISSGFASAAHVADTIHVRIAAATEGAALPLPSSLTSRAALAAA